MAYNHGREDRKWRIWKEAEEKLLRECGVDEATIEQIRIRSCRKRSLPLPCVCEVLYGCRKLHCAIPYYKTSEKHTVCKTPCY